MSIIPEMKENKNYWLIRTNGGRFYEEYRNESFIGIAWNEITTEDIDTLTYDELNFKVREKYPEKKGPGRATSQLRTFSNNIKKGDTVMITSYASNKFSIGEVSDDSVYTTEINKEELEVNPKLCTYEKRRKINWLKEVRKWDVEKPMFKLIQHARNAINDANEYADNIDSLVYDLYIRGDEACFSINVKKEEDIPANEYFRLVTEILNFVDEYGKYNDSINQDGIETDEISVNSNGIITTVNMNSKGKTKLRGPKIAILVAASLITVVGVNGGGVTINLPEKMGGGIELQTEGILKSVSEFLDEKQSRENERLIMKEYMDKLEIDSPDELKSLLEATQVDDSKK